MHIYFLYVYDSKENIHIETLKNVLPFFSNSPRQQRIHKQVKINKHTNANRENKVK